MKRKIKYLMMMFMMFLMSPFADVNASTYTAQFEDMKQWIPNEYVSKTKGGTTKYQQMTFITRKSDNQFVYCIEPGMALNSSTNYTGYDYDQAFIANMTQEQWRRIQLLAYYGYGYSDSEVNHNATKWYTITQVMIWQTVPHGYDIYFTDTLNGNRITKYTSEMAEMESLLAKHYVVPNFGSGNYEMMIGSTLKLTDHNSVLSKYSVTGNSAINVEKSGNDLYLTANSIGSTNITMKKADAKYSHPTIVYVDPDSQDVVQVGSYDPINISLKINVVGGKIKITKVDSETNTTTAQGQATLVGATYNVYDSNNNVVASLTIGSDKTATTGYLPLGTYTIREVSNSTGYYLDGTTYTATISSSNVVSLTVKETVVKGKLKITKLDSETNACKSQGEATLVGAKYGVYDHNNKLVDTLTIGNDCTATSKSLPYGNYKIKELQASTGYYIDETIYDANITNSNTIGITSKENVIKGKIKVTKHDSETNACKSQGEATLVGAKYGVYDYNNKLVDTLIIGNDCTATSRSLPYGNYKIKELEASVGYEIDTNVYNSNIVNSNTLNILSKENVIKGRLKLTKVDSETKTIVPQGEATLVGAKYGIYDKNDNLVDTITIGDDSTATTKLLPYGHYKVKELENSKGYYLNTKIYSEFISEAINYPMIVEEDVIKNDFKFYKFYGNVDTGFIFAEPNATFKILNNKEEVVLNFTTDKNGYAKVTLPYGNYQVYQVKGLDDYKLMFPFAIRVNEDTSLTQISHLKNGTITAKLKLVKIDSETKMPIKLAGIKFKIKNKKTNDYICQTTNKVICEFETNEDGVMITPLPLFGGDYIIEEITAPNGYLLSDETIEFSIKENSEIIEDSIYGSLIEIEFENDAVKGKIEINKTGENAVFEDNTFKYETIKLEGAVFEVRASEDIIINGHKYYSKDELVGTLTSDELGYASIDNLPLGKYYIKEISSSNNNIVDQNIYNVELKYKDQYTDIISINKDIKNYLPKGDLVFTKSDLINGDVIPNTIIEIYTIDNKCIFVGTTDENGQIIINELPVGKYYILEKQPATGYINSEEKEYFEIKEDKSIVKAEMKNKPITGSLEFTKISFSDSEPLPNTLIEIYTESDELVFSGRTNSDGKIIIDSLKYGKYYILEKEAPDGFLINDEKMWFQIKEDGIIVKAIMKDEKIKVPNTGIQDSKAMDVIGIVFIIGGLGYVVYEKRKNK